MRTWAIGIGNLMGVELRLHVSFLALVMFLVVPALDEPEPIKAGLHAFVICLFALLAVVVHEAGHIAAAVLRRTQPRSVILLPLGGVDHRPVSSEPAPLRDEIAVALAGPATSIAVAAFFALVVKQILPEQHFFTWPLISTEHLWRGLVWVNLGLGLINLLPFHPLDAGRILRSVLARSGDGPADFAAATRYAVNITQAVVLVIFIAAMLKSIMWLMLLAFFLFVGVQIENNSLIFQLVTENVRLEEIMLTSFATLSPVDTLREALDKAIHTLQDDFPVIRGSDLVGTISRQAIVHALKEEGDGYVQAAMDTGFPTGTRADSLGDAFRKIAATRGSLIPIVEEGRLIGVVTLQHLTHSMGLLAESRKLQSEEED